MTRAQLWLAPALLAASLGLGVAAIVTVGPASMPLFLLAAALLGGALAAADGRRP